MTLRINTNVAALTAHNNMIKNDSSLSSVLEQLSSGLRINKAADDASGMAIADSLKSQALGLGQAIKNANDGISMVQTADGALAESINIVNTIKTKAIQAAQDGQTTDSRNAIQSDITKLMQELDNIAKTTAFNGQKLLSGNFTNKSFQIGAYSGETVAVSIDSTESAKVGHISTSSLTFGGTGNAELALYSNLKNQTYSLNSVNIAYDNTRDHSLAAVADSINKLSDVLGVSAQAVVQSTTTASVAAGTTDSTFAINGVTIGAVAVQDNDANGALVAAINQKTSQHGVVASVGNDGKLTLTSSDGRAIQVTQGSNTTAVLGGTASMSTLGQINLTQQGTGEIVLNNRDGGQAVALLDNLLQTQGATTTSVASTLASGSTVVAGSTIGANSTLSIAGTTAISGNVYTTGGSSIGSGSNLSSGSTIGSGTTLGYGVGAATLTVSGNITGVTGTVGSGSTLQSGTKIGSGTVLAGDVVVSGTLSALTASSTVTTGTSLGSGSSLATGTSFLTADYNAANFTAAISSTTSGLYTVLTGAATVSGTMTFTNGAGTLAAGTTISSGAAGATLKNGSQLYTEVDLASAMTLSGNMTLASSSTLASGTAGAVTLAGGTSLNQSYGVTVGTGFATSGSMTLGSGSNLATTATLATGTSLSNAWNNNAAITVAGGNMTLGANSTLANGFVLAEGSSIGGTVTTANNEVVDSTIGMRLETGSTLASGSILKAGTYLTNDVVASNGTTYKAGSALTADITTSGTTTLANMMTLHTGSTLAAGSTLTPNTHATDSSAEGTSTKTGAYRLSDVDVTTQAGAQIAISVADSALKDLDKVRSGLGSVQNQLTSTISNISVTQVNVTSAESNIRDTDFAEASSNFSRMQILVQAGSFAMAQSNASGKSVLSLLQG
ncbi:MAG: flagellin [Desulfobacteraceae bacterium]|nr:flagellin [Desulfobacteraceae bacterium]